MNTLENIKKLAKFYAENVQAKATNMSGTELYEEKDFIPQFDATRQYLNFKADYVCKSEAGRIVKLIQPYDSTIYTQQPEELPAQWGFKWSKNPKDALPFIALSTSPFDEGDCCTENGVVYRSKINSNVYSPSAYPQGWEVVVVE